LIIDTNALLDEPGLLSQFSDEHQTVVIPLKVMEELDGLKENPRTTQKAQRAIKAIESARQQHPGWRIGESADTGLLPREIKPTKGDGQILATAIRFALADPVLITGDVNLRNRSEAMGIRSRGWREYMKEAQ
jgi:PhoH-like ATPase